MRNSIVRNRNGQRNGNGRRNGNGSGHNAAAVAVAGPSAPTIVVDALGVARPRPSTAGADAFRTLALTVDRLLEESDLWSVAVLSAHAGDGRSLTAELLALALSEIRPPVRLLDADPFHATVTDATIALDLVDDPGNGPSYATLSLGRELFANQHDFLRATRTLFHRANEGGATLVVDLPPCGSSSIAFAVARMADCAIYVARTGSQVSTTHAEIRAQLDLLGVHLLGVVFNER
jgi:Mrp family chromosome partitioning ATPase